LGSEVGMGGEVRNLVESASNKCVPQTDWKQKLIWFCEKSVFIVVMKTETQLILWKKCVHERYENRNSVNHVEKVFSERLWKQKFDWSCGKSVFNEVMKTEIRSILWKKCLQRGYENRNSVNHVEKVFSERLWKQKFDWSCGKSVFIVVMKTETQLILWKKCLHGRYESRNSVNHVEKVFSERLWKQKFS
jgi:murein L,D-transpeptidase YafK